MKILITNDDGLQASQLIPLIKWAQKLGEVTTVVPKYEQSGKSHGIELHKAFEVTQVTLEPGITAIAVDSTPADCVRYAIMGMHETYDLVISGINRGLNIGRDIMYSGTCSAAMEAAGLGINAMALSTEPETFDDALAHLDHIWAYIQERALYSHAKLWNVNIPLNTTGEIRMTRQGGPYYSDDFAAEENDMYRPMGKDVFQSAAHDEFDTDCVLRDRCISITPLTVDRTDWTAYNALKD